jgi:hypothetical protein
MNDAIMRRLADALAANRKPDAPQEASNLDAAYLKFLESSIVTRLANMSDDQRTQVTNRAIERMRWSAISGSLVSSSDWVVFGSYFGGRRRPIRADRWRARTGQVSAGRGKCLIHQMEMDMTRLPVRQQEQCPQRPSPSGLHWDISRFS